MIYLGITSWVTLPEYKDRKIHKHSLKNKILDKEFNNSPCTKVFCKAFVDIVFENASFLILEDPIWLQLIYFLSPVAFWFVKCLLSIDTDTLN